MANKDRPFGFVPWGEVLRARYYKVATAPVIHLCVGDMVQADNTGGTSLIGLIHIVKDDAVITDAAGATFKLLGAVLACFDEKMDPLQYIDVGRVGDGSIAGYLLVADHPDQQFVAQGDAAFSAADIDLQYDIHPVALNAPDTNTGLSTQEIGIAGAAVTTTIPIRLYGQSHPDEDVITAAGCRMICQINPDLHQFGTFVTV